MPLFVLGCIAWLLLTSMSVHGQAPVCDGKTEQRVNQESYFALTDRVYVHVADISSTGSGWQAFTLRVLIGNYRRPFLLRSAPLKQKDLDTLLRSRPDLRQTLISVPASTARREPAGLGQATVPDGERTGRVTVRVSRVVPVRGAVDHLYLICSLGR